MVTVEIDSVATYLPMIIAIALPLLLYSLTKFGKTSEGTITGTIRLEGLKSNMDEIKDEMRDGLNEIKQMVTSSNKEARNEFEKISTRIGQIEGKVSLHEFRLNQAERQRNRDHADDDIGMFVQ